jgi:hypothetical protein
MKKYLPFMLLVGLLVSCSPSKAEMQQSVEATLTQIATESVPTATPAPTPISVDQYKANIKKLCDKFLDNSIKISDLSADRVFGQSNTTEKHESMDLLDQRVDLVNQMVNEPTPVGYEKAQDNFKLMYDETVLYVQYSKSNLIAIDISISQKEIDHLKKEGEYYGIALSYLK